MPLSDEVRRELAAIEPRRDCDRLAELSGLFHTAGSLHLLGHGEFAVHLDLAEAAVARRAFGLLRGFGVEAEIRTYRPPAFDRATRYQIHVPGGERSLERAAPRGRPLGFARAARGAAEAGGRARLLPRRVPARRASRRRLGERAPRAAPRDPHVRAAPAPTSSPPPRPQDDVVLPRPGPRAPTRPRTPRARRRSPTSLALAGAGDAALALDEHAVVGGGAGPGEPGRERRPRQPRPLEPSRARASSPRSAQLEAEGGSRDSRPSCARSPSCGYATPRLRCASCREVPPATTKAAAHRRLGRLVALADRARLA